MTLDELRPAIEAEAWRIGIACRCERGLVRGGADVLRITFRLAGPLYTRIRYEWRHTVGSAKVAASLEDQSAYAERIVAEARRHLGKEVK